MSNLIGQNRRLRQRCGAAWRRGCKMFIALATVGLTGCVVLPADTVVYDDDAVVERGPVTSPDVVIIDRGPFYAPPPPFWYDSHWGYRHGYRRPYRHGYRDGRRPRIRGDSRWEGRQGRSGVDRGARQRGGEFRGRIRSDRSSGSMTPHLDAK